MDKTTQLPKDPEIPEGREDSSYSPQEVKDRICFLDSWVEKERQKHSLSSDYYVSRNFWWMFFPVSLITLTSGIISYVCSSDAVSAETTRTLNLIAGSLAVFSSFYNALQAHLDLATKAEIHRTASVELKKIRYQLQSLNKMPPDSGYVKKELEAINRMVKEILNGITVRSPSRVHEAFSLMEKRLRIMWSSQESLLPLNDVLLPADLSEWDNEISDQKQQTKDEYAKTRSKYIQARSDYCLLLEAAEPSEKEALKRAEDKYTKYRSRTFNALTPKAKMKYEEHEEEYRRLATLRAAFPSEYDFNMAGFNEVAGQISDFRPWGLGCFGFPYFTPDPEWAVEQAMRRLKEAGLEGRSFWMEDIDKPAEEV